MADAIDIERRADREEVLRPLGISPAFDRVFISQGQMMNSEAALMAQPVDTSSLSVIQDQTTGQPYFMVDMDPVDGGNPIA